MANVSHASLTGADLHEPKGISTAANNTIYVCNGAGTGSWLDASSVISNSAWFTGDTKLTFVTTAPTGWILFAEGGTIGDGSSGGTVRANADTSALFTIFWNAFTNTQCPVSGGRGASAAADFAAHKTLQLPPMASRAIGIAGSGAGLTARALGATVGTETVTLALANLPNYAPVFTGTANGQSFATSLNTQPIPVGSNASVNLGTSINLTGTGAPIGTVSSINGNQAQTAFSVMQPSVFLNLLIKL